MADAKKTVEINVKVTGTFTQDLKKLNASFKDIKKTVDEFKGTFGTLSTVLSGLKVPKEITSLAANLNNVTSALRGSVTSAKNASNALITYGKSAQTAATATKGFGDRLKNYLQYRLIADTVMGLQQAFLQLIPTIADYDQALKDLQAITGASDLEVAQMGDTIKRVASTTKFSAAEVAQGMRTLGQAGFSAQESMQTMQAVADLATGTLSDMSSTVDLLSTAMRVFDIQASQSAHVADVFANAVNKSKLTIDKLRISMNYVGPIAAEAGVSFEEMSAAMATLANAGIRASTIGTGLRRVFAELLDPSKGFTKAIGEAGFIIEELDPRANSLTEVIGKLGIILEDSSVAFEAFGKRGAAAALALTDSSSKYATMLQTISETGTAARMAEIQMEGLGVSIKNLQDKIGLLAVALGEAGVTDFVMLLVNAMRALTDIITLFINTALGGFLVKLGIAVVVVNAFRLALAKLPVVLKATAAGMNLVASASTKMSAGMTVASRGGKSFLGAGARLNIALAALAASYLLTVTYINRYSKATADAAKASAEVSDKIGVVQDYLVSLNNLSEGSIELKQANLGLRSSLQEVANANGEASDAAQKAAFSIDSVTGMVIDNGDAIRDYQSTLNSISFEKMKEGINASSKNLDRMTGNVSAIFDKFKEAGGTLGDYFKTAAEVFGNVANGEFKTAAKSMYLGFEGIVEQATKAQVAADFSDAFNKGNKSFEQLANYISTFDFSNLTAQQETLVEGFKLIDDQSSAALNKLLETGQVDMRMTREELDEVLTGLELDEAGVQAVIYKWEQLNDIASKTPKTGLEALAEEFKDGESNVEGYIEAYVAAGGEIDDIARKHIQSISAEKAALAGKYEALNKNIEELRAAGYTEQFLAKKRALAENELKEELRAINKKVYEDFKSFSILKVKAAKEEYDKILADNIVMYKNQRILGEQNAKALIEYNKKVAAATVSPYSPDKLKADAKAQGKVLEEANAERLYNIALQEATAYDEKVNYDALRLESEQKYYADSLEVAQDYFDKIAAQPGVNEDSKEYVDAQNAMIKAKKKFLDFNRKALIDAAQDERKALDKTKDLGKKLEDEEKKSFTKRKESAEDFKDKKEDIEQDLADTIEDINKSLTDKLNGIDQDRADAARDFAADVEGIHTKSEDAIRDIRQRGMTDAQKQADDLSAVYRKLQEGKEAVEKGRRTGDTAELERGQSLLDQAFDIAKSLDDQGDAIRGVRLASDELEKARGAEDYLDKLDAEKKKQEEIAEAATKRQEAEDKAKGKIDELTGQYNEIIKKEEERHVQEVTNIEDEITKWERKLEIAKELRDLAVGGSTTGSGADAGAGAGQAGDSGITSKSSSAASNAAAEVQKVKEVAAQAQAELLTIQKQGYTAIEANGKQVYTNMATTIQKAVNDASKAGSDAEIEIPFDTAKIAESVDSVLASFEDIEPIEAPIDFEAVDAKMQEVVDSINSADPELKLNTDSLADAKSDLDEMDGKVTRSTHIVQTITTAMTGGLVGDLIQGFSAGGSVFKRLASRFITAGSGLRDDVPALLKKNEFVQSEPATSYYGANFMRALNARIIPKDLLRSIYPGFESGGLVSDALNNLPASGSGNLLANSSSVEKQAQVVQFDIIPDRPNVEATISSSDLDEMLYQFGEMRKFRS